MEVLSFGELLFLKGEATERTGEATLRVGEAILEVEVMTVDLWKGSLVLMAL